MFISALAHLHDVHEHSCFDMLDKFQRRHEISDVSAHKLSHVVAVACLIRLFRHKTIRFIKEVK